MQRLVRAPLRPSSTLNSSSMRSTDSGVSLPLMSKSGCARKWATPASRRHATRSWTFSLALFAVSNVASSMPRATTCTRTPSSGNQLSSSVLRNVPGRWAIASEPASVLWSVMVTKSMPRARWA